MATPVKVTQGFLDHSRETSRTSYYVAEGAGDDLTTAIADADAVHDAMAVITLCNFLDQNIIVPVNSDAPTVPGSENAQREQALWVQYVDDTTGTFETLTIPGADRNLLAQINTDEVDIQSNVTALALIAVLEAKLVSRAGNSITVTRMRLIGRAS